MVYVPTRYVTITYGLEARSLSPQYGRPDNSTRPGGPQFETPIQPPGDSNTTYRILADNVTVQALIPFIQSSCSPSNTLVAIPFNDSSTLPKPEQAIQYYRASSIALTLDAYNNTAVFSDNDDAPSTPLPSGLNQTFLNCLNTTIGAQAPLFDGAMPHVRVSGFLALGLVVMHLCTWSLY